MGSGEFSASMAIHLHCFFCDASASSKPLCLSCAEIGGSRRATPGDSAGGVGRHRRAGNRRRDPAFRRRRGRDLRGSYPALPRLAGGARPRQLPETPEGRDSAVRGRRRHHPRGKAAPARPGADPDHPRVRHREYISSISLCEISLILTISPFNSIQFHLFYKFQNLNFISFPLFLSSP